jgi:hypothetical protein
MLTGNRGLASLCALVLAFALSACASKQARPELTSGPGWTTAENNLHQVDGATPDGQPGYRLYRSGMPDKETFAKWCQAYKIERVIVMSGDAKTHELAYQAQGVCPNVKVIYNVEQKVEEPVTVEFLTWFDEQVAAAKRDGVGLLFRCQTGSHRTGRLAAYYQMKYQGLSSKEAIAVMNHLGMMMPVFDAWLVPQVRALEDYLKGRPCSQRANACVQKPK